jgi:3-oxoadipate enol-lactonase
MPDAHVTHSVQGRSQKIAYRRAGSGRPVVLLHPLALSSAIWGAFAERLAQTFDVIATDARGHGDSDWDGKPFGIDDLADDVSNLLDGLSMPFAHIVGMSMGGSTAIRFAGRYPQRVMSMVLADTTSWYGAKAPQAWEERASTVLDVPRPRQVPFQVDRWFTEAFRARNADEVNWVVGVFLRTSSLAHAEACRALGGMDSRSLLPAIAAPTLVLTGAEDYATTPEMGETIAQGVQNGTAVTLESLRHLSLVENPGLAAMTERFLGSGIVAP